MSKDTLLTKAIGSASDRKVVSVRSPRSNMILISLVGKCPRFENDHGMGARERIEGHTSNLLRTSVSDTQVFLRTSLV